MSIIHIIKLLILDKNPSIVIFLVKEKVKMIAQQQEEIVRREEMKRAKSGESNKYSRHLHDITECPPPPQTLVLAPFEVFLERNQSNGP